ncbi:MAG: transcription elongation factor NusA [Chlamydiales bacterium]|jgi:N utilization substance protein A|nr:transcription elongation factor NusA [Chlamydiales bacterium]
MNKELIAIFEYLEKEKGIKKDVIISAIEESLLIAARNNSPEGSNISVQINPKTGDVEVFSEKEIVEDKAQTHTEISIEDARVIDPECEIGQYIDVPIPAQDLGRIAAQKARQFITQKLRHAERDVIYQEYRNRVNEIVSGTVKRFLKGNALVIDLGKVEAVLSTRNYPKTETYNVGDRIRALLLCVRDTENGGAEVVLTRSHPEFVKQLLIQEVPEINDGIISIQTIVREAGYRTKLTVQSTDPRIDPVGACIGMRGNRIKNVLREINNEKIDVIHYYEDPVQLLQKSLGSIAIRKLQISPDQNKITIVVDDEDFPVVVGKRGANSRLNSELIGRELQVWKMSEYTRFMNEQSAQWADSDDPVLDQSLDQIAGVNPLIVPSVIDAGYTTLRDILLAQPEEIARKAGISTDAADKLLEEIRKQRM